MFKIHTAVLQVIGVLSLVSAAHAAGDPSAGQAVFAQCAACHSVGAAAQNGIGPVLNGVVGRTAGTYPGYRYSSAMRKSGLVWDEAVLTQYLRGPDKLVPGTKMAFAGVVDDKDLADVVAYLKQQSSQ